ncbi:MAG: hypothetical protein WC807_22045 [Hyphomicrobium sp.]|jgi:hypothetical protein
MLTADELRGLVSTKLHGSRRVVRDGMDQARVSSDADIARYKRWYRGNREHKLAYQAAYEQANREKVNERVRRCVARNPERAKQSARAKHARVYAKKKALARFMAAHIAYATSFGGAK